MTTLAFDVYGTLIDPHAIRNRLALAVGEQAAVAFSRSWRDKQLEYSFRRAAMGLYGEGFGQCTREALDFCCAQLGHDLASGVRAGLLQAYLHLDAFDDAQRSLVALGSVGFDRHAFSNGHPQDLQRLLSHAGLLAELRGVVSVHEVGTFKPDPRVYHHFNATTGSSPADTWLVSSNPFDIIGARAVGWRAAWVRRDAGVQFDCWAGLEPTRVVGTLDELAGVLG